MNGRPGPGSGPAWRKPLDAVASWKPVTAVLKRTLHFIDRPLMRLSKGRLATTQGMPTLLLTTTGRKSGELRSAPLLYFDCEGSPAVIGTYFGSTSHPAWYLNLQANPRGRVLVEGAEFDVTARPATPRERVDIWQRATRTYGGYEKYKTRVGNREIPIIVLDRT